MIDNLRAMYIFVKSVELGSFRATAGSLSLSPSVVSYHISQLESDLKVALLYRSTRKLTLTHEGKLLFDKVMPLVDGLERGIDQLVSTDAEPVGSLHISSPTAFSRGLFIRQVTEFMKQHPKVNISIRYSDDNIDLIGGGIDLAIRGGPMKDSTLKARKIFSFQRRLVASPEYFASKPEPKRPQDLENWDWIQFSVTPKFRILVNRNSGKRQKIRLSSRITVDNGDAMCNFVVAGLGLSTPTDYLIDNQLESEQLVEVLPEWYIEPIDVHAVWPANSPRTGLTNLFVDYLVASQPNYVS